MLNLSHITVKHKSHVITGDKIGIEGISGNAGKRHLHFGVHYPKNINLIEQQPRYTGISVPFNMKFKINSKSQVISSMTIPCSNDLNTPLLKGSK